MFVLLSFVRSYSAGSLQDGRDLTKWYFTPNSVGSMNVRVDSGLFLVQTVSNVNTSSRWRSQEVGLKFRPYTGSHPCKLFFRYRSKVKWKGNR